MKIESFILEDKNAFFLKEELSRFPEIFSSLRNILTGVNANLNLEEISINDISRLNEEQAVLLTIFPQDIPRTAGLKHKVLLIDRSNPWGRFSFFEDYLKISKFHFNKKLFREMIIKRGYFREMQGINGKLSFLPFVIHRWHENRLLRYFPWIIKKDLSYFKNLHSARYCSDYRKPRSFKKKFMKVIQNLNDEISKRTFKNVLYGKAEDIWKEYFLKSGSLSQYSDYIKIDSDSVIISCGIDFGTEIPLFLLNTPKKIYHIDPCGDSNLNEYIKRFMAISNTENVFIKKILYTDETVPKADRKFEVTTLAKFVEDYKINKIDVIKSDIEGAERYMVDDLLQLSKKFRPQLAISIYHSNPSKGKFILDDLVDIPLKLMRELTNYKFYISHYCYERWDVILYCIPSEI